MDKIQCLDLGCGENPTEINTEVDEYYGLDIIETNNSNVKKCDLFVENIPFESDRFDYVTAFDFMEHVPRVIYYKDKLVHPMIHIMDECHRVLKKGGKMIISSPSLRSSENFFWNDPTHINPLTSALFFLYFCTDERKKPENPWANIYNFKGNFKFISSKEDKLEKFDGIEAFQLVIVLQKI